MERFGSQELLDGQEINGIADKWIASIELLGAKAPLHFINGMYEGMPFMTEQEFGKGYAMYCGAALLDENSYRQIVSHAVKKAGIQELEVPQGVEVIAREPITFILNYSEKNSVIRSAAAGKFPAEQCKSKRSL